MCDKSKRVTSHPVNEELLQAVRKNNIDEVKSLLRHPNINRTFVIGDGSTVLFESLYTENVALFRELVFAGFDVNFRNCAEETPLHIAVMYAHPMFVQELITMGADINAKDYYHRTPLVRAASLGRKESVCMLLYHGADVNIPCRNNMTPLMYALESEYVDVAKILFNYYDDFSCKSKEGITALHLAAANGNQLAIDIFLAGTNETECFDSLLLFSLEYENAELFKLVWSKYKEEISLDDIVLIDYLSICAFDNQDWLDCLYLLLTAPVAFEHILHCKCNHIFGLDKKNVLTELLISFYTREIVLQHRISLIYLCLSFGVKIDVEDVNVAFLLYGFNEEFEAFLYAFNYQQIILSTALLPLPRFIFVLEDDYKIEPVSCIFQWLDDNDIKVLTGDLAVDVILKQLGFCSLPLHHKEAIKNVCKERCNDDKRIAQRLDEIPEIPSLFELSRNQMRQLIKQKYNITKSYQFHTVVKELNLPSYIKDVIRFKTTLY